MCHAAPFSQQYIWQDEVVVFLSKWYIFWTNGTFLGRTGRSLDEWDAPWANGTFFGQMGRIKIGCKRTKRPQPNVK